MKHHSIMSGMTILTAAAVMAVTSSFTVMAVDYPSHTTCTYYYDQFDENTRRLYDDLLLTVQVIDNSDENFATVAPVVYSGLSSHQLRDTVIMFMYDHPEFFWLQNAYRYGRNREGNYVQLSIYPDFQSGESRQTAKAKIIEVGQHYIDAALEFDTDYDRAVYLTNQLSRDIGYQRGTLDQSLASAFLEGKTVCAGYTKAYSYLANAVGVDTITLIGANHGWNATKIAGNWYHNDVTNSLFLYCDEQISNFDHYASHLAVTDADGNEKIYYLHSLYYDYYTDIFPDMSAAYDGASMVIGESLFTQTGGYYEADAVPRYFFAEDIAQIDPASLITALWHVDAGDAQDPASSVRNAVDDLSALTLDNDWLTPAAVFLQRGEGDAYFHGTLRASYQEKTLTIGDVRIVLRGDFDLNGITDAADAASVLMYAASVGSGAEPVLPVGVDPDIAMFAGKLSGDGDANVNASDAAEILTLAAEQGANA